MSQEEYEIMEYDEIDIKIDSVGIPQSKHMEHTYITTIPLFSQ